MGNELNAINETDVQQSLTRAFGLRDRVPCPTLAPELQAVVLAADLTSSPPFDKKRVAGVGTSLTSGGGSAAVVQWRNPAGSGVIARLSWLSVSSLVGQDVFATIGPIIAGAQIAPAVWLNTSLPGVPACDLAAGSPRAVQAFWRVNFALQGYPGAYPNPIILTPGFSVQFETIQLGQTIQLSWAWEEFPETPTR